jgi:transposase
VSKTFRPWAVDDIWLLPPSVQDFVPAGHAAHLVRDLVGDELDLSSILSVYTEMRGYPHYHPGMVVRLLLYAYSQACTRRAGLRAPARGGWISKPSPH